MKTDDLEIKIPKRLIAKEPAYPRESARLMVVKKNIKKIEDSFFFDIDKYFKGGDVLVFNRSKVFPARAFAKTKSGKKIEILFLREESPKTWSIMIGGRTRDGERVKFNSKFKGIIKKGDQCQISVNLNKESVLKYLDKHGEMPLPPYIKRKATPKDKVEYQNIFADTLGSAAAPTAGLHFSKKLLKKINQKGVNIVYVTLHVGLGTFLSIKNERVEDHQIHSEYFEIDKKTADLINSAKKEGRRIIACGTTSLRALESATISGKLKPTKSFTDIYIYPGYQFKIIDGLITNFHTPRSTLLALVYAFGGQDLMKGAYQEAVKKNYRFFSYGDGMIIF